MSTIGEWLIRLELEKEPEEGMYLWPHTPVGNLQAEIWRRVGASDWNMEHPSCRAASIVDVLQEFTINRLLSRQFTVLDFCCGDGVVLFQIGRAFLDAQCYGIDLLRYPAHRIAETRGGCALYKVPLQEVVKTEPPRIIDVAIMLNTFRGWDKAALSPEDAYLPQQTLAWMHQYCRYIFVTVTGQQMTWLKRSGWFVWDVGSGEDGSRLVCGFPTEGPEGPRGVWTID